MAEKIYHGVCRKHVASIAIENEQSRTTKYLSLMPTILSCCCSQLLVYSYFIARYKYDFVKFGRQDYKAYCNCTLGCSLSKIEATNICELQLEGTLRTRTELQCKHEAH